MPEPIKHEAATDPSPMRGDLDRRILDSAVDFAIIATGPEERIIRWSPGATTLFGWSEAEMLGQTIDRLLPADDERAVVADGGTDAGWHLRRSGERFWGSGAVTTLHDDDGRVVGCVRIVRDHTAEHAVAEALRSSEQRLLQAQQAGGVGVFSLDIATGTMRTSPELCRIFGVAVRDEFAVAEMEALVVADDLARVANERNRSSGDMALVTEYRIRRPNDGEIRTISRRAEFERDAAGRTVRLFGVVQDVTEQRAAQAAVAESEAKFRAFTEAVPNQVWSATPDGTLDWANRRTFDYDGADQHRLDTEGWETQVHPDDLARAAAAWASATATGAPYEVEFRLRRADGVYRWHLARAVALRGEDGAIERWIGTNTDIDDQRQAQQALADLNATLEERVAARTAERHLFAAIVETTDDQIQALDLDYRWLAINAACVAGYEQVYGVRPQVGDSLLDLLAHHPAQQAAAKAIWARALAGEAFAETGEWGDLAVGLRTYELRFEILRSADGTQIGAFLNGRDVTDRLAEQARLAQAEDQLRQAQKMEAVGQLTGGVAHDFNNLLTVIRGSVDLLRRDDLTPERRARYIEAIGTTADRAAKLTGQLLSFARRQALTPELFDAGAAVGALRPMLGTLAGSRIVLDIRVPDTACFVLADRSQFDTTIVNLAINARDAMDGDGALTITCRAVAAIPPLRGHAGVAGDFISVSVEDRGVGIAAEDLDRIFEPFYTTKPVGHGTGLGLSQVIGFAKQSGGDIQVESVVGGGTVFTLYLPRELGRTPPPASAPHADAAAGGDGTFVLVVEDNAEVGAFASDALAELGYRTVLASDGHAALAELARGDERFRIVFTDVVMPGMSGLELGHSVRDRYPHVAVVLTSGYSHVLAQTGTHGFELLHKPYSVEQLARCCAVPERNRALGSRQI